MTRIGLLSAAALFAAAFATSALCAPVPSGNLATSLGLAASLTSTPVSGQVLTAEVSEVNAGGKGDHDTGDATLTGAGDTNAQYAGVQTVSQNTGQQTASNAATGAAVTASITFGSAGGAGQNNH